MSPRIQLPDDAEPEDGIVTSPRAPEPEPEPVAPPPLVDTARERRLGRIAGAFAILSVIVSFATLPVAASDLPTRQGENNDRTLLIDIGQSGTGQITAMWMRVASALLLIALVVFLSRAIRSRQPAHAWWIPLIGITALTCVGLTTALEFFDLRDAGREFISSGQQNLDRAEVLVDGVRDQGHLRVLGIAGGLLLGVWVSITSLEAMRIGLFTRFLGVFGIGVGLGSAIGIPVAGALFIGWSGSVAALALGWWPGGRPPAWDEGRAMNWDEIDRRDYDERRARREGAA